MADPPVVVVPALGEPSSSWQRVTKLLATSPAVITYDRPGIGARPPRAAPNPPLPYSAFAAELAALLDQRGVNEPVVLVGHSIGSLIIRAFAAAYLARVAGMVYVDGSVPEMVPWPGDPERTIDGDGPEATEIDCVAGNAEIARAAFPAVPSIVLARTPGWWPTHPPDLAGDRHWQSSQADLARRSGAALIVASDSGHHIQMDAPGLVAFAVDHVITAVREGRSTAWPIPDRVMEAGGIAVHRSS